MTANNLILHRAPWVVSGIVADTGKYEDTVFQDGAVLEADGRIRGVGRYRDLVIECGQAAIIEHDQSILTPALINGHTHLELSYLAIDNPVINRFPMQGMTEWIRDLLSRKQRFIETHDDYDSRIISSGYQALDNMFASGVTFAGDIGNHAKSLQISKEHPLSVSFLLELIGFTGDSAEKSKERLLSLSTDQSFDAGFTAHAPYSVTSSLMQEIKKYCRFKGDIFSIHTAESTEEIDFLHTGAGTFKDFLTDRGAWDDSFKPPGSGAVKYLDQLGVLDQQTLCVHTVHIDEEEINLLADKQAKVCLCPGSNRLLGVGKAPVTRLLAAGILPAIGTDSLASNLSLNMWREMQILREDHPSLDPAEVFSMATVGGASAWGLEKELGTLAKGKRASFLAVRSTETYETALDVLEFLTVTGEAVQINWAQQAG